MTVSPTARLMAAEFHSEGSNLSELPADHPGPIWPPSRHPPLHLVGVSMEMERGCQQNDSLIRGETALSSFVGCICSLTQLKAPQRGFGAAVLFPLPSSLPGLAWSSLLDKILPQAGSVGQPGEVR